MLRFLAVDRRVFSRALLACWALSSASFSACTMVLDTDAEQCATEADCARLRSAGPGYTCEAHYCVPRACSDNAACPTGLVCADGACAPPECETRADCSGTSPTLSCDEGRCVDPVWGCIGAPDERPDPAGQTGSLRAMVITALGTEVEALEVNVCAAFDLACEAPLDVDVRYEAGELMIDGLPSGEAFVLRLSGRDPLTLTRLVPVDYYMARTVSGDTELPHPLQLFDVDLWRTFAALNGVHADVTLSLLIARVHDCADELAAGLSLASSATTEGCGGVASCATRPFYFDKAGFPVVDATETNGAGFGGILNLPVEQRVRISVTRAADGANVATLQVVPRRGVAVYTDLVPRDYGLSGL